MWIRVVLQLLFLVILVYVRICLTMYEDHVNTETKSFPFAKPESAVGMMVINYGRIISALKVTTSLVMAAVSKSRFGKGRFTFVCHYVQD